MCHAAPLTNKGDKWGTAIHEFFRESKNMHINFSCLFSGSIDLSLKVTYTYAFFHHMLNLNCLDL